MWAFIARDAAAPDIDQVKWVVSSPLGGPVLTVTGSKAACPEHGSADAAGSMSEAAAHTGQVTPDAFEDLSGGIIEACLSGAGGLYRAQVPVSVELSPGAYTVEVIAEAGGATASLRMGFEVLPFIYLVVDFTSVDWSEVTPGSTQSVAGNFVWDDPPGNNPPTVANWGNAGMQVGLRFKPMLLEDSGGGPSSPENKITTFAAKLSLAAGASDTLTGVDAGEVAWFDLPRPLCGKEHARLDLRIEAPDVLQAGRYAGEVVVLARPAESGLCSS
jgi:hypothetical protein